MLRYASTSALRLPRSIAKIACNILLISTVAMAYEPQPIDGGGKHSSLPALGINEAFGRWTGTVKLVYDPDNAPAAFPPAKFHALLGQAITQWETVSGIRFQVVGTDTGALDDANLPLAQRDGLVRIFWGAGQGFNGLAGPEYGSWDQNLGYYPYQDGDIKLNQDGSIWNGDLELVSTLAHELGHLIGLGHSDNPLSIMYANPYNNLNYPREDDIRAVQALYGAGNNGVTPQSGVSAWRYLTPPAAAAGITQFLFKPNEVTGTGAYVSLQSSPNTNLTKLTAAAADGQFVRINAGGIGGFTNNSNINVNATLVVVDPDGYLWGEFDWPLQCAANFACNGSSLGFAKTEVLKTYPGNWKFLWVDKTANTLLQTLALTVETDPVINKAPVATVSAAQGATPAQVTLTLKVSDSENNAVTVIWHGPSAPLDRNNDGINDGGFIQTIGTSGTATHTIDYSVVGTYTLFVELRDNSVRYGDGINTSAAGDGFSNLLQLRVNLPLNGFNGGVTVVAVQHSAPEVAAPPSPTLTNVAAAQNFVSISTAGSSAASYTMGASKDNGASTNTNFKPGDSILVGGVVKALAVDIGKSADIFVVIRAVTGGFESWLYRDSVGNFRPWSGSILDIKPALQTTSLSTNAVVEVYKGPVGVGTFQVFLGYKVGGSSVLHYSPTPLSLTVTN